MSNVIVITGASSGIGRATAERFAENQYTCVLNARSHDELQGLASNLPGDHEVVAGDITEEATSESLRDAVEDVGGIDVLFANAGYGVFKPVEEFSKDEFEDQFATNVTGVFLPIKHLLPVFRDQDEGSIIVTSSMAAKNTFKTGSAYAATKHAVQGFIGCVKQELRDTHVKCASILPGSVDTAFFKDKSFSPTEDRHLNAEDVARTVSFVAEQPSTADLDEIVLRPAKRR